MILEEYFVIGILFSVGAIFALAFAVFWIIVLFAYPLHYFGIYTAGDDSVEFSKIGWTMIGIVIGGYILIAGIGYVVEHIAIFLDQLQI